MSVDLSIPRRSSILMRAAAHADAFFISDDLRQSGARPLANARMGLIGCITIGVLTILHAPTLWSAWPPIIVVGECIVGLSAFVVPVLLRQRPSITFIGHYACSLGLVAFGTAAFLSGGRSYGILLLLPLMPIIGLLTRGAAAAAGWGMAAFGILGISIGLSSMEADPMVAFTEFTRGRMQLISGLTIGSIISVAAVFDRIWDRSAIDSVRSAQAQLVESEERYRNLLENATEGVLVVDPRGVILWTSPAAAQFAGIAADAGAGRSLSEFIHPDDIAMARFHFDAVTGLPNASSHVKLRARGAAHDWRIVDVILCNRSHVPAVGGIVIHVRDVTEFEHVEANYRSLVDDSIQGMTIECDREIVYVNQALADISGLTREQIMGPILDRSSSVVHPDDFKRVRDTYAEDEPDTHEATEFRVRGRDGSWKWLHVRWTDIKWEGREARQVLYLDVTAERELEEARLRQQQELEARIEERTRELAESQQSLRASERLAAVGTLAAGVAHQINNPLGAILTSADFALLTRDDADGDKNATDALREIRGQAIRCGKIVRSVLKFSRSESTEKWTNDVVDVIRTALDSTARYAAERGATIKSDLSTAAKRVSISMNPIEIEQALINIVRNAIESKPTGAEVRIAASCEDGRVVIEVQDDGCGVLEADRDHLFEPFFTTRLAQGGTGLGLSVAYGVIQDHNGHMEYRAREPHGSCFRIELPIEKSDVLVSPSEPPSSPNDVA